jgi:uncharacterized protein (TIGR00369 family)
VTTRDEEVELMRQLNTRFMSYVPHNRALGLTVDRLDDGEAVMTLPYAAELVGNPESGVLHGGAITSLMDACCGAAVFMKLRQPMGFATLDLRIDYLKPAVPPRAVTTSASCFKLTRNVAFVRGLAFHDAPSDAIAAATGTFMLSSPTSPRPAQPEAATAAAASEQAREAGASERGRARILELIDNFPVLEAARDSGRISQAIPYAQFLGLELEPRDDGIVGRMKYADHLVGNPTLPALHGGTIGALLESAAIFKLLWEAESTVLPKTINLTIQYLRSARPVDTFARGIITRHGRRVAAARAEAWQDDPSRPVAIANGHFLVKGSD